MAELHSQVNPNKILEKHPTQYAEYKTEVGNPSTHMEVLQVEPKLEGKSPHMNGLFQSISGNTSPDDSTILKRTKSLPSAEQTKINRLPPIDMSACETERHNPQKRRKSSIKDHTGILSRDVTLPEVRPLYVSWSDVSSARRKMTPHPLPLFRDVAHQADEEVEHNWMLQEAAQKKLNKLQTLKRIISISLPDEDPMVTIQRRIDEVKLMTRSKKQGEEGGLLSWLPPERREFVMVSTE